MTIRLKLLLPLFAAGLLIWAIIASVWQPIFIENQKREYIEQHSQTLSFLANHILYESVNQNDFQHDLSQATLLQNDWWQVELIDHSNQVISSYKADSLPQDMDIYTTVITHHFNAPGIPYNKLVTRVNLKDLELKTEKLIDSIKLTILGLLLISILISAFIQEIIITKPLKSLALAARQLTDKKEMIGLPTNRKDEVGDLARSFSFMQDKIFKHYHELLAEVESSRLSEQTSQLENLEYLQAIIKNVVDGIITIDQHGTLLSFNPAAEQIFGYQSKEVLGRNISLFINNTDEQQKHDQYLFDYISQNKEPGIIGIGREVWARRKNGEKFPMDLAVSRVETRNGVNFVGIVRDISKRKEIEVELNHARIEAEKASELKSKFLANISHEIRTPMNGILGMMDILRQTHLNDEQIQYAEVASRSGDALLTLLNDLLDVSKIEAGKIKIERISFCLSHLINDITKIFSETATTRGIQLTINNKLENDMNIVGDPTRIRQILNNLLSNAIKFTNKGGVTLDINSRPLQKSDQISDDFLKSETETSSKAVLVISVRDTGIGISSENKNAIFKPFTQADDSTTRIYGGTGLGLSISHELAKLMGGNLILDSEFGKGSTFTFLLPTLIVRRELHSRLEKEQLRSVGIVIFGNNPHLYKNILPAFKKEQIRYTLTNNVEECLTLLSVSSSDKSYSIVVLDFDPVGIAVCRRIRSNKQFDSKHIVAISHTKGRGEANAAKDLSVNAYLPNNTPIEVLITALQEVAVRKSSSELITRHSIAENETMNSYKILVVEDNEVNQKVVSGMLRKLGCTTSLAENGKVAIEILEKEEFDVILMDLQMPIMDGFDASKAIRALNNNNRNIPILALSADAAEETVKRCLDAGMNEHISKPLQLKKLEGAIIRWTSEEIVNSN
ncbi:MAG: response regulator [Gammaproteobacteria bacterium]|nr:response regulator [Gammaproteobacteria bacterium]